METDKKDLVIIELKRISKLLALNYCKEFNKSQSIEFLSKLDYSPKEISEIIETSPEAVRSIQSRQRSKSPRNEE